MSDGNTPEAQPSDYPDDAKGWAGRWKVEIDAATKALEDWRNLGDTIDKVFRDERDGVAAGHKQRNLFTANIITQEAMLYGATPKTDVSRRFADANDDVARVSCELLERIINSDVEKSSDSSVEAFGNALNDRLLPGCGQVRVRYDADFTQDEGRPEVKDEETGSVLAPAVGPTEYKSKEDACIDYVHWKDFLWGKCRVWSEAPWVAFAADMAQAPFTRRFGAEVWGKVPKTSKKETEEEKARDPWARVRVWEIWHKETKKVFWYVDGYQEMLDEKDDPLQLDGFWPCPKPMMANITTSKLVPRPDYVLSKDLYESINNLTRRIDLLQSAVRAAGVYNREIGDGVKQILSNNMQNILIPVENWALFAEKGGMQGNIAWVQLDQIIAALQVLTARRMDEIDALHQDSGFSDIMRGQATQAGATATEQAAKTRFGSVRMQRMQDEFARFVSDAHRLKGEVVCKHFDPETIIERANARYGFEKPELVMKAVQLLKSEYTCYRIEVKPENVALADFAQLKQERTEVIGALSTFLQAAAPLVTAIPGSMPFLLKLLQTAVAGLKGSSAMEGVIDEAITTVEMMEKQKSANPQQAPPDPKVEAQRMKMQGDQMKAQADLQKQQMKHQADLERISAETQAHDQQEQSQAQWNVREAAQKQMVSNALKPKEPPKTGGLP